jgi:hypothetical protein
MTVPGSREIRLETVLYYIRRAEAAGAPRDNDPGVTPPLGPGDARPRATHRSPS